jgi:DNA-binding XRE family transcriptional regulator
MEKNMTLEQWLEQGGTTMSGLAKQLGTSRQAVQSWVTGRVRPKIYFALAIEVLSGGKVTVASWLTPMQALAIEGLKVAAGGPQRG